MPSHPPNSLHQRSPAPALQTDAPRASGSTPARQAAHPIQFWMRVAIAEPKDCWPWTGTLKEKGYGMAWYAGRSHHAHRLAWQLANRQAIPAGLQVCHACDNPPCCNPAHLWIGTNRDNTLDSVAKGRQHNARKTHCPRGHLLDAGGIRKNGNRYRYCSTCNRSRNRQAWRARRGT